MSTICFFFLCNLSWANFNLNIIVDAPVGTKQVFIAGNFNNWNPGHQDYKLASMGGGRYKITINLSPATYRFKFTQGAWITVESDGSYNDIVNRVLAFHGDTTIYLKVRGWLLPFFDANPGKGHKLTFTVSGSVRNREIFITGNFAQWQPKPQKFKLHPLDENHQQIVLENIASRPLTYQFTRGTWTSVESSAEGIDFCHGTITVNNDTAISVFIGGWVDEYVDVSKYPDTTAVKILLAKGSFWQDQNLDSTYKYSFAALTLAKKLQVRQWYKQALRTLCKVQMAKGNDFSAIELLYEELNVERETNDSAAMAVLHNFIGDIFLQQNDTVKAKESYRQAIVLIPENKFSEPWQGDIVAPFVSMGRIFLNEGKLDSAEYYGWQAVDLGGGIYHDWSLLLLGDIAKKKGDFATALGEYRKALQISDGSENSTYFTECLFRMASIFYDKDQKDSSFYFAQKAFKVARETKSPYQIISTGSLLVKLYKDRHQLDSAFLLQEAVLQAKDSVYNKERERQLQALYYKEKIKQQQLHAQNEKFQSQRKFYFFLAGLAILLFAALQYHARVKSMLHKKTAAVEMKALRAQMNPHFIFNCLSSINRYIVKSDPKTASGYLTKFAKLIRFILDNSVAEYITLETEMETLQLYIEMELLRFDNVFTYEIMNDSGMENIVIPPMLVQPYVENAIRHGLLHKDEKGKLLIRFKKHKNNLLVVEVEDDGVGRQKAKELESHDGFKNKSYGMQISKDRIQLINRLFRYKTSLIIQDLANADGTPAGTKVSLKVPLLKNNLRNKYFQYYDKSSAG